ncbi:hypothetical protein [Paenibacillus sp. UMB4589-SE434]|uniref:hypothetical protein n=1 Tax=Paenibacillus sp. UMB4589-SE434 TaxID=3046314 RepID=UPI00254BD4C1|nr:hypothetical protein [Paenibacillus sp. UMB4589-SE434]MDK8181557.1 hypothetical protein [Paenibacillus sp. UMB4589-SE434]
MKTWTKFIVTTGLVAMVAIPLTAGAQAVKPISSKPAETVELVKEISKTGTIQQIVYTKNGAYMMFEGKEAKQGEDLIRLNFTKNTLVVDQDSKKADLFEALEKGWKVTAKYGPAMTKSLPPQASATKFVIERVEELKAIKSTGVIAEAKDNRLVVVGTSPVILTVTDETVITDVNGNKLDKSALKSNTRIEAEYGPIMTMSMPPMSGAKSIVVLGETARVEGVVAESAKQESDTSRVHIDVKADDKLENDIILNITGDTKIVDVYGQELKTSDLTKGVKVVGFHSLMTTRSIPAISNAVLVVVQP